MGAKFRQPPFSVAEANIISKSITANGTYNATSDNADGYNPVTVNVPESIIVSKNIIENGTYNATSDNADGYNPITVNVPTITETLLWSNQNPNTAFNSQSVTLGGNISEYDYLKIVYKRVAADTVTYAAIYPTNLPIDGYCGSLPFRISGTDYGVRFFIWYGNINTINFTIGYNANNGATSTDRSIPLEIYGCIYD